MPTRVAVSLVRRLVVYPVTAGKTWPAATRSQRCATPAATAAESSAFVGCLVCSAYACPPAKVATARPATAAVTQAAIRTARPDVTEEISRR